MPLGKHRQRLANRLPSILIDEHLSHEVGDEFRKAGFRVSYAATTSRFKGRDEHDYVAELHGLNTIFITSDFDFAQWLSASTRHHAGVVYLPTAWNQPDKAEFAELMAIHIRVRCEDSRFALRDEIIFTDEAGIKSWYKGKPNLLISWDKLYEVEEPPARSH